MSDFICTFAIVCCLIQGFLPTLSKVNFVARQNPEQLLLLRYILLLKLNHCGIRIIMKRIFHLAIMFSVALSANATDVKDGLTICLLRWQTRLFGGGIPLNYGKMGKSLYQLAILLRIQMLTGSLNLSRLEMVA